MVWVTQALRLVLQASVAKNGQVAQSVEQWTENPRVGGSIPPLTTTLETPFNHLVQIIEDTSS